MVIISNHACINITQSNHITKILIIKTIQKSYFEILTTYSFSQIVKKVQNVCYFFPAPIPIHTSLCSILFFHYTHHNLSLGHNDFFRCFLFSREKICSNDFACKLSSGIKKKQSLKSTVVYI